MSEELTEPQGDELAPDEQEEQEEGETLLPDEQEEPAPVPPPPTEQDVEKMMKAMEKEQTRHSNRVSEIMGEDANELTPCPLCIPGIQGFIFEGGIADEQRENVLTLLVGTTAADAKVDPDAETCPVCDGRGETLTGSKVLQHLRRPCPACLGMGYLTTTTKAQWEGSQAVRNLATAPPPAPALYVAPPNGTPDTDRWGRPRGHWLYGKDPEYLAEHERAGDLPHIATG